MSKIGAIVGSFLVPVIVLAQTPDFSGEWKLDSSRRFDAVSPYGLHIESPSQRLVIRQDRQVLYVEEHGGYGVAHMKYGLVGQTIIQPAAGQIDPVTVRSKSRWEGTKFVTTIEMSKRRELQQVRSLRPDGAMVVEMRTTLEGRSYLRWAAIYVRATR